MVKNLSLLSEYKPLKHKKTMYTIQANPSGTRSLEISEENLATIEKYGLFRHLIDSNGIVDESVLEKLRLNIRSLIASQEEDSKDLLDLCIDVIYHNNMKAFGLQQLIKLYLEQLVICICRRDDNVRFSQRAITSTQFHQHLLLAQQARDYLAAHYSEALTLPSLAAALGISVSQLKRVFHEQIGQSMVRYLTALRIGEAKRLIREGNLTFTQIAERIGIESIYYFSNLFKKQTGMSPTEYEKTLKE